MRLHMEAKKISYFLSYSRATQKPHVCSAAGYKIKKAVMNTTSNIYKK